ncbi:MAG: serpin family protein, partial [Clostridiales bacterium]|nr:serpin family protein [Clostridiales bacterium]
MKEKKMSDTHANISDEFLEEARESKEGKKFPLWQSWTVLVVSVAIIIVLAFLISREKNQKAGTNVNVVYPKAYAFDDFNTSREVREQNPVDDNFIKALDEFTYKTSANILTDAGKNINYSPISLYYALSLAASGAEGETKDQLLALLGVSDKE